MTALLKPTERSYGSPYQRKLVCEGYYAICLLKHITPIFATLLVKGQQSPHSQAEETPGYAQPSPYHGKRAPREGDFAADYLGHHRPS